MSVILCIKDTHTKKQQQQITDRGSDLFSEALFFQWSRQGLWSLIMGRVSIVSHSKCLLSHSPSSDSIHHNNKRFRLHPDNIVPCHWYLFHPVINGGASDSNSILTLKFSPLIDHPTEVDTKGSRTYDSTPKTWPFKDDWDVRRNVTECVSETVELFRQTPT